MSAPEEYTPTLEEVRDVATLGAIDAVGGEDNLDIPAFHAMFDRAIAEVRREQIIKDAGIALAARRTMSSPPEIAGFNAARTRIAKAIREQDA